MSFMFRPFIFMKNRARKQAENATAYGNFRLLTRVVLQDKAHVDKKYFYPQIQLPQDMLIFDKMN